MQRVGSMMRVLGAAMSTILLASCGAPTGAASPVTAGRDGAVRYRLLLASNPVDPVGARRCYSACRLSTTEEAFVECLQTCPGLEVTPGAVCGRGDGPPRAACVTRIDGKLLRPDDGPTAGEIVVAVVLNTAIIVGMVAACGLSSTPSMCVPPPPPPR